MIAAARTILRKDLLIELRTKESVPAMVLFSITVYVLFHFGLDRDSLDGALAAGVLWVTLLLAAVIGVSRLFAAEREQGGIDGLLLSPGGPHRAVRGQGRRRCSSSSRLVELVAVPAFGAAAARPGPRRGVPRAAGGARARATSAWRRWARWWRRSRRRRAPAS